MDEFLFALGSSPFFWWSITGLNIVVGYLVVIHALRLRYVVGALSISFLFAVVHAVRVARRKAEVKRSRNQVGIFIKECNEIRKRCFEQTAHEDLPSEEEIDAWITKVTKYLSDHVEDSFGYRFSNPPSDRQLGMYAAAGMTGNARLRVLDHHMAMLHQIAAQLDD